MPKTLTLTLRAYGYKCFFTTPGTPGAQSWEDYGGRSGANWDVGDSGNQTTQTLGWIAPNTFWSFLREHAYSSDYYGQAIVASRSVIFNGQGASPESVGIRFVSIGNVAPGGQITIGSYSYNVHTVQVQVEVPDYFWWNNAALPGDGFGLIMGFRQNRIEDAGQHHDVKVTFELSFGGLFYPGSSENAELSHSNQFFQRSLPAGNVFSGQIVGRRLKIGVATGGATDKVDYQSHTVKNPDSNLVSYEIIPWPLGRAQPGDARPDGRFPVDESSVELLLYVSRAPNAAPYVAFGSPLDVEYRANLLNVARDYVPQFPPLYASLPVCRVPMSREGEDGDWSAQVWLDLPDIACNFFLTAQILSDSGRSAWAYRKFENGLIDTQFNVAVAGVPLSVVESETHEVTVTANLPSLVQRMHPSASSADSIYVGKRYGAVWMDELAPDKSPSSQIIEQFEGAEILYRGQEYSVASAREFGFNVVENALSAVATARLFARVPDARPPEFPEQVGAVYSGNFEGDLTYRATPLNAVSPPYFAVRAASGVRVGYFAIAGFSSHTFGGSRLLLVDASKGAWQSGDHGKTWQEVEGFAPAWSAQYRPLHVAFIGHNELAMGALALRVAAWPSGQLASSNYPPDPTLHFRRTFDGGKTWDEIVDVGTLAPRTPLWGAALWVRNLGQAPFLFIAQGDTLRWCSADLGASWQMFDSTYEAPLVPGSAPGSAQF